MEKITLEQAVDKLRKELKHDKSVYNTWQANIAMAYKDNERWYCVEHKKNPNKLTAKDKNTIANNAGKYFLDLLIL